jgi:hypothetical protein
MRQLTEAEIAERKKRVLDLNTERRGYELELANTLKGASLMRGKIRERTAYINVALEELATGTTDDEQRTLPGVTA